MRLPCEIVVNELLPFLRKSMAERLHSLGFTQTQVAQLLNVSQPAVSYYLKQDMTQSRYSSEYNKEKIVELTDTLLAGEPTPTLIRGICQFCMSLRTYGTTCRFHREQIDLEEECTACIVNVPLPTHSEKNEVLQDLRIAIGLFEQTPEAVYLMPEVAIQIVRSISDVTSTDEVAAVPGRIVKVRGQLKSIARPEFGVSSHMAKILMNLIKKNPTLGIRAAICMRYDQTVQQAIDVLGITYKYLKIDYSSKERSRDYNEVADTIKTQIARENVPEIIIDPGGEGREPIAYLFGKTAVEAAHQAIEIARRISRV